MTSPELWPDITGMSSNLVLSGMRTFTAVVEKDAETGLYVGYVPGFSGAHSQGSTKEELRENLHEVIQMLLDDGEPPLLRQICRDIRITSSAFVDL